MEYGPPEWRSSESRTYREIDLADLDRLYVTVKQQKGRIDILFANAGVGELVPLGAITEAYFDKTFDINVKGLLFTVQKATILAVAKKYGKIKLYYRSLREILLLPLLLCSSSSSDNQQVCQERTQEHQRRISRARAFEIGYTK